MTIQDRDIRQRFLFEYSDIRGEILTLEHSYQAVLDKACYPAPIAQLLGEFLAGACLLSATLKFDGIVSLQAAGTEPLSMVMADCTRHNDIRAIARYSDEKFKGDKFDKGESGLSQPLYRLKDFLGENATLAVTIDPSKGERYQGIIPIENDTLSGCLTDYFSQSEQLPTKIWLQADEQRVGGLLLQALPSGQQKLEDKQDYWHHLTQLAQTLTAAEQLQLSHGEQLHRLFHAESLRLFMPSDVQFACSCSKQRTASMLASFGFDEITTMLSETNPIEVRCQFCHELYLFYDADCTKLFSPQSSTLH